jgi:hypothetical protein
MRFGHDGNKRFISNFLTQLNQVWQMEKIVLSFEKEEECDCEDCEDEE